MKKLYKIKVTHAAPKSYHTSIEEYIIAENNKQVFNYLLKSDYTYWEDYKYDEDYEDYEYDGMNKLEYILENNGESTIESKWQDLYYGSKMYDWEYVKDITNNDAVVLTNLGIAKDVTE